MCAEHNILHRKIILFQFYLGQKFSYIFLLNCFITKCDWFFHLQSWIVNIRCVCICPPFQNKLCYQGMFDLIFLDCKPTSNSMCALRRRLHEMSMDCKNFLWHKPASPYLEVHLRKIKCNKMTSSESGSLTFLSYCTFHGGPLCWMC